MKNVEIHDNQAPVMQPHILVVDDEPLIRAGIRALLNKEGYKLQFAEDGKQGLEMAFAESPDVILLDVMMPGMDGFEFCKIIRESEHLSDVPIVFISALDDKEARLKGFEAGADEYLAKPFDGRELRFRLRTLTRLNRYRKILSEQKRFEWVFENSPDALVALNAEGVITNLNSAARSWLGYHQEDTFAGHRLKDRLLQKYKLMETTDEASTSLDSDIKSSSLKREIWFLAETSQSKSITLEIRYGMPSNPREGGAVAQIREVTDQDDFRTMSQIFMNLISHKMLTPLNILQGAVEVLKMDHPEIFDEEYGQYLQEGLDQVLSQTRKILAFTTSHFDQSKSVLHLADVKTLVDQAAEEVGINPAPSFHLKDSGQCCGVRLSHESLSMLFVEAFSNAQKFHPEKSPDISVEIEAPSEGRITIKITDNGIHLSPKQLQDVTRPFVQGEKYFTGNVPGWGIGLNLLRRMLEKVGGKLELRNREDRTGVCLYCSLPCESIGTNSQNT